MMFSEFNKRQLIGSCIFSIFVGISLANSTETNDPNPQAIRDVASGKLETANAAWWGFNREDATDALQSAIDSKAKTVRIPYMGNPWIVRPITLRSHQEIVLEPGVVVLARQGEFKGTGDCLLKAADRTDITIRGYGAVLRMRKKEYQSQDYAKGEWRMTLAFTGCKRILVEGLRCESSGGDGVYIGSSPANRWCEDVTIRDVVCHDNYRQGISVISAVNLLIENCRLSGTCGTPPGSGIDLEPDLPDEKLVNCVIRNCVMEDNEGHAILVYLKPLTKQSEPVSILFENCLARMNSNENASPGNAIKGWAGMAVGAVRDDGPKGTVEFRNCVSENTGKEGAKIFDKSADSVRVRFVNCSWKNPWMADYRDYGGPRVPILVILRETDIAKKSGGVDFERCSVFDSVDRPALWAYEEESDFGVFDLTGDIAVHNPNGARMKVGSHAQNVKLKVHEMAFGF